MMNATRCNWFAARLALTMALANGGVALAEEAPCVDALSNVRVTTPTARFDLTHAGVAVDTKTNLMWERCTHYFTYSDSDGCVAPDADPATGIAPQWAVALDAAASANAATHLGFTGWRLPNVKELLSIVERACASPALNETVFPGIGAGVSVYWSGTPVGAEVVQVDFNNGSAFPAKPSNYGWIRLVRDAN